jgi:hypothetical protein
MKIATYNPSQRQSISRCRDRDCRVDRTNASASDGMFSVGVLIHESDTIHHSLHFTPDEAQALHDELSRRLDYIKAKQAGANTKVTNTGA